MQDGIPKRALFKAAEVCDLVKVQPYVLRSWEAEFPELGIAKSAGAPRVYRRTDVAQVLRIKHLLLVEGLTLAGARRRLEDETAPVGADAPVGRHPAIYAAREHPANASRGDLLSTTTLSAFHIGFPHRLSRGTFTLLFGAIRQVATVDNALGISQEEDGRSIYLCREPGVGLDAVCPSLRPYD